MTILGLATGWASASNERAVANARAASTACSRRRVEREEVAQFLREHRVQHAVRLESASAAAPGGVDSLSG